MIAEQIDMSAIEDTGWYQTAEGYERVLTIAGKDVTLSAADGVVIEHAEQIAISRMSEHITHLTAMIIQIGGGVGALMEGVGDDT